MNNATIDALQATMADVLERYAFVFGDACDGDASVLLQPDRLNVSLEFKGPVSGAMVLSVSPGAAHEITANVLGGDSADDVSAQQCEDAVKELLNVMCGQFLLQAYGGDVLFELTAPGVTRLAACPSSDWTISTLDVDGDPVVVLFKANA